MTGASDLVIQTRKMRNVMGNQYSILVRCIGELLLIRKASEPSLRSRADIVTSLPESSCQSEINIFIKVQAGSGV